MSCAASRSCARSGSRQHERPSRSWQGQIQAWQDLRCDFAFNHWKAGWQSDICGCSQRAACRRGAGAGGLGYVLRPTLAGHRFRFAGVAPSTASVRALVAATANGACARTPSHLPRHPGGMQRRGTPARMHQGGGGAPGRRPDSRLPPMVAGHGGVDAAADCSLRRPPASVGRRTGAPPPPWRRDVGMLTVRRQATVGRLHPPDRIRLQASSYACIARG